MEDPEDKKLDSDTPKKFEDVDYSAIQPYLKKISDMDRQFRGAFLLNVSAVENYLTGIIGWFFFPTDINERMKLVGHIINDINFSSKIRIFLKLLQTYHKDVSLKHPTLKNDLESIRKLRNQLAHSSLDTSVDYLLTKPTKIRLESWEGDKRSYEEFSLEEMNKKIREASEFHSKLIHVLEDLTGEKQGI